MRNTMVMLIGLLVLLSALPVLAQDVKTLANDANKALRESQNQVFAGKLEEAAKLLEKAADLIAQIKAADPNFAQLKSLEDKYNKQKADLEKRLSKGSSPAPAKSDAQPAASAEKLPGGVTSRLKKITDAVQKGAEVLTKETTASDQWRIETAEGHLTEANGYLEEISGGYGNQVSMDHPDITSGKAKIAELQQKIEAFQQKTAGQQAQAANAQQQSETQSQEWLAKFTPYIAGSGSPDHNPDKYLIGSGTDEVPEMQRRKAVYTEVAALWAEYQKATFPNGKTDALAQAEKDLAYALQGFEAGYQETIERFAGEVQEKLTQTEQWLATEEAKNDGERKPLYLSKDVTSRINSGLVALEAITNGAESRLQDFTARLTAIEDRSTKLRQLGKERTVMTPDTYQGEDRDRLKTKAAEFLRKDDPDAAVLRTTIISEDWKEEQGWEYTDTTKSVLRYRITRSVTAQIAGKRGNEVFLYTIDISEDKQADGSWGTVYGHVMFVDPMIEANINK